MLLDAAPGHTAESSLREAGVMNLLCLPNGSPKPNPINTLWGQSKDIVSANRREGTIEGHVKRFLEYINGLSNAEARRTCGALYANFRLRDTLSRKFCLPA